MMRRLVAAVVGLAAALAVGIPASEACGSYGDFARMRNANIQGGASWLWSLDPEGGKHIVWTPRPRPAGAGEVVAQAGAGAAKIASR